MALPLSPDPEFGFMAAAMDIEGARETAEFANTHGFESVWTGDRIEFPTPVLDPLIQLQLIAAFAFAPS